MDITERLVSRLQYRSVRSVLYWKRPCCAARTRKSLVLGDRFVEDAKRVKRDGPLAICLLPLSGLRPGCVSWTVVHLFDCSVGCEAKDEKMFRLSPERYASLALGELDLDVPPIVGHCIVNRRGTRHELESEHVRSNHLTDTAHQVAIWGELPAEEDLFQTVDDAVEGGQQIPDLRPGIATLGSIELRHESGIPCTEPLRDFRRSFWLSHVANAMCPMVRRCRFG